MYDRNGLELTPVSESLNSYRLTAVNTKTEKYVAYAAGTRKNNQQWNMFTIGQFEDPRDAAYAAQEFEKKYNRAAVREMVTDDSFKAVAKEFRENIDIPEWEFPAEGLTIGDIKSDYGYSINRVENAKDALREAIITFSLQPPALKEVKSLVEKVEKYYTAGFDYRAAARKVFGV